MRALKEFIATIGKKRFVLIIIMGMIVGLLGAGWQYYLLPQNIAMSSARDVAQFEANKLQKDIRELPARYAALIANEKRYDGFREQGFFEPQERIAARSRLDILRMQAGLRGINYNLTPQEAVVPPNGYTLSDHLVRSYLEISFRGLTDLEMRDFIKKMQDHFHGLVVLEQLSFERGTDLDQPSLFNLSQRQLVDFVTGKVSFSWYSLLPNSGTPTAPVTQAFGGQM